MRGQSVRCPLARQLKFISIAHAPCPVRTSASTMRFLLTLLLLSIVGSVHAAEPMDLTPVKKWIAKQDDFHSVQADFTQTRALKALRSPVASPGRLTFVTPNLLRWELGDPPKTIVLRKGDSYT